MLPSGRSPVTVIDLDPMRITALSAVVSDDRPEVRGWLSVDRPANVAFDNPDTLGEWIGQLLKAEDLSKSRVVLAVPRGDVVLKKLVLPGAASASETDLAGIVRLQMSRQLTMAMDGTAVDYTTLASDSAAPGAPADAAPTVSVMAGAMPADRIAWCRRLCEAGGLSLHRIALRCSGAAAAIAELSQRRDGPVMAVVLGASSVEFVIVENGQMAFARAIDIALPKAGGDVETYADRVAVEAKRTWMSHRGAQPAGGLSLAALLGAGEVVRAVGARCGQQLESPWEAVSRFSGVMPAERTPEAELSRVLPLLGLLIERSIGLGMLDFANPRRAPDLGAARRRNALLAVLGSILLGGGSYVWAQMRLDGLADRLTSRRAEATKLQGEYATFLVKHARLNHLEQWTQSRVDWMAFLDVLGQQLPDTKKALLDGLAGQQIKADILFNTKSGSYPEGAWALDQLAQFQLDGKVAERAVAADLRGKFLDLNFDNVSTKGPDMPDRFSLAVETSQRAPKRPETKPADTKQPNAAEKPKGGKT